MADGKVSPGRDQVKSVLVLMGVGILFWIVGSLFLDMDFGFQLKLGEMIVNQGIPRGNPWSYTMPSYPFVDHEWFLEVVWYKLWPILGMTGLAAIYAASVVAAMWIVIPEKVRRWGGVAAFLGWGVMMSRFAVRPQVTSWILTAVVLRWVQEPERWRRWRWLFPLLMLVWTNLHGSFLLGIGITGLALGFMAVEKKADAKDGLVWGLGVLATFINPYGWRLIWEMMRQVAIAGRVAQYVVEWQPVWMNIDMGFIGMSVLTVMLWWRYRKRFRPVMVVLAGIFGMSGWLHLRHAVLAVLAMAPIVTYGCEYLAREASGFSDGKIRWRMFFAVLTGVAGVIFLIETGLALNTARLVKKLYYPEEAVKFLEETGYPRQLFASYNWGGYLIWKMPRVELFVDGRMPSFSWKAPVGSGESDSAITEYSRAITNPDETEGILAKYGVKTVLWQRQPWQRLALQEMGLGQWSKWWGWGKEGEEDRFLMRLNELGWKKAYEDGTAVVYFK